jgi:hypothetical protein
VQIEVSVQAIPSSQAAPSGLAVPLMQSPAKHASPSVQSLPSLHDVPFGFAGLLQRPVPGSHVPALRHWPVALQMTGLLPTQTPFAHASLCVHALPSLHAVPSGFAARTHAPVCASHVPASTHGPAPQVTGEPPQTPEWHASACVQAFPSSHVVPSGFAGEVPQTPVAGSHVPATWH